MEFSGSFCHKRLHGIKLSSPIDFDNREIAIALRVYTLAVSCIDCFWLQWIDYSPALTVYGLILSQCALCASVLPLQPTESFIIHPSI